MALVEYSDSDSESPAESNSPPPAKKARKNTTPSDIPPLPAAFHDLYATSTRVSVRDDPSLHGGRYPSNEEFALLSDTISQMRAQLGKNSREPEIHSLLRSDLGVRLPLHISLSRPAVLRTEQRQSFMTVFQTAIQKSHIEAVTTTVETLDCVSNFDKTRWFYVLRVSRPADDSLNRLLGLSNRYLALFDQPPLYANSTDGDRKQVSGEPSGDYSRCFHISLAWSLTEPSLEARERIASMDLRSLGEIEVRFDCVKAKIGNQISSISLA
ncbi:hypothetical protein P168DRAFT_326267 [Aspergillus campestris IBT 28561]|uniref:U6 snRNA phosphodiesterase n=1 Tax=Aspergillus campestris (strain IBT 28561) TaxID=1392248 RepID=A0A2I1D7Z5_ASPC2|nr:uncharacterized protein P168DRAFT_326267 [Aspergillus campestris IBT 28561]PKY05968.1 hypothetical protein P168DRAFT_326267 [Aspergillus campestris IBT 28561]